MRNRTIRRAAAVFLTICLVVPMVVSGGAAQKTKAADASWAGEVGDTDQDGRIDVSDLIRIKKNASESAGEQFDLNNDSACDDADATLMREFLVGKICSFYRPDTSSVNNDTHVYTVTDELDREMYSSGAAKDEKAVGMRYFLHFGTEESNPLYSVSKILETNSTAYQSSDAWEAAGGGAVGTKHWWGEPLFGYYTSLDAWVMDRDVQMLTDAGIDFLAVDMSENVIYEEQLTLLLQTLNKYYQQGFEVPKVTFTSISNESVSTALTAFYDNTAYSHLWYKRGGEVVKDTDGLSPKTVRAARSFGAAMSESAFYGSKENHQRSYNGTIHVADEDASLWGYNFAWEFEKAIADDPGIILVESWNEWTSERTAASDDSKPIVLSGNADMANSSDLQPMNGGYGDDYYMQLVDHIKQFKGSGITNRNLNTAAQTEGVSIDINGEFSQWNKVNTHYLDYTGDIADRDAEGYETGVPNKAVAIKIDRLNENDPMSFITKEAYAGGSMVSFKAYVPEGVSWWAVSWTTDPADTDLYKWTGGTAYGQVMTSTFGAWADYSVTLPDDGNNYYIYIVGAKGEWNGTKLLIDDFKITKGSDEALDQFTDGVDTGLFSIAGNDVVSLTTVKSEDSVIKYTDTTGRNDISRMKMTTDGTNLYCLVETVDAIRGFGSANCMSLFISTGNTGGCWNQYEYVVNRDSSKAADGKLTVEKYVGGRWTEAGSAAYRMEGNKLQLAISLSVLGCDDAFSLEFKWADNYSQDDIYSFYTKGDAAPYGRFNYVYEVTGKAAAIDQKLLSDEAGKMNVITKKAYPGGSEIAFRAYVPQGTNWWGISWTTDKADTDLYKWTSGKAYGQLMTSTVGAWADYSVTLPDDENQYYIYLVADKGSDCTATEPLLIDDFTITSGGVTEKDTFNGGLTHGLFDMTEKDGSGRTVVGLQTIEKTASGNKAAAIHVKHLNANGGQLNFITQDAYPGGSTVSFRAYVPEGVSGSWWGVNYVTDPSAADIYGCASKNLMSISKFGTWADYSVTLPNDGNYYYVYVGGPAGNEWGDNNLLVDDFKVTNASGSLIAKDNFNDGFGKGIFRVTTMTGSNVAVSLEEVEETVKADQAAAIKVANLCGDTGKMNFITANPYPAGSTITFDAFVPAEVGTDVWWAVDWTTDPASAGMYDHGSSGQSMASVKGEWANYTVNLPAEGGPYYFYIVGPAGDAAWKDSGNPLSLLVDNVKVISASGNIMAEDDFDHDFAEGIFSVTEGNAVSLVTRDTADDGAGIAFTAYAAPTVNRNVSADTAEQLDDAYKKLSEAGFNKAIALHEGCSTATAESGNIQDTIKLRSAVTEQAAAVVLDIADKYGVKYYVKDWSFYGLGGTATDEHGFSASQVNKETDFQSIISTMFGTTSPYIKHNAYAGNFAFDEPYVKDLEKVQWQAKYYEQAKTEAGSKGELFVNLLPAYVAENSAQLGNWWDKITGGEKVTYSEYVDKYIANIAKPYLGYVCWDNYPFMEDGHADKATREKNYLYNMQLMADKCKDTGIELRTFVQVCGDDTGIRKLDHIGDLRFQIYSGLAFGVKDFIYYGYSTSHSGAENGNCLFDYEAQQYTWLYDAAKQVNNEVHEIEQVYNEYQWADVMYKKVSSSNAMLEGLKTGNTAGSDGTVTIASCTQDTMAGIFTAKDSTSDRQNAYMFVNVADPKETLSSDVTVQFASGTRAVLVCRPGMQTVIPISSNQYTFTLSAGEGLFAVPLK